MPFIHSQPPGVTFISGDVEYEFNNVYIAGNAMVTNEITIPNNFKIHNLIGVDGSGSLHLRNTSLEGPFNSNNMITYFYSDTEVNLASLGLSVSSKLIMVFAFDIMSFIMFADDIIV